MDLFDKLSYWADQGIEIDYLIIDQIKNGMKKSVINQLIPLITFTVNVRAGDEYLYEMSHDCPKVAIADGVEFAEREFPNLMNEYYKNHAQ